MTVLLLVTVTVLWALGFVFLGRITLCRPSSAPEPGFTLSVIVPARNEEENLPGLLQSLTSQDPPPDEIIVVDDSSSDQTAAVAVAGGARMMPSHPLPAGWRGKTWACQQGANEASGSVLIFMDADTRLEPHALRAIRDTYARRPGVLSIGPYHKVRCYYEELSAFFNLIMTAGTGAFTIAGRRLNPGGLFGPFLMVDRRAYELVGGHAAVRGQILENFFMAPLFGRAGIPMRCCGGRGTVTMRMYPHGVHELQAGWAKAFATGAAQTPLTLLLAIIAWLSGSLVTGILLAIAAVKGELLGVWLILYVLYAVQIYMMLIRIGSFRWITALCYPVALLFYLMVFMRSLVRTGLRKNVSWKGRSIDLTDKGAV